ncbi:PE family protein [Mycobacterium sp.]|uniref:PE family protein n=1 Tax=Mycobacterium sp. TaxID=1785 RepID=UPI003C784AA5
MSFVLATPEVLVTAAADLAGIGSTLSAANAAAAAPTTRVLAAASDQVSTQVAALLSEHALEYQQLGAQVSAFHEQFVRALTAEVSAYAATTASINQFINPEINWMPGFVPPIGSANVSRGGCAATTPTPAA